jgi:hypothetical protein
LHWHALSMLIVDLFLQHRRLRAAKRGKKETRRAAATEPAGYPAQAA